MSELERAQQLLNTIPAYKLGYAISFDDKAIISAVKLDKSVETAIRNCNSPAKLPDTAYIDSMGVYHPSSMEE